MRQSITGAVPANSIRTGDFSRALRKPVLSLTLLCSIALVAWFCQQPLPALQDYGEWVFQGWAMGRLVLGDPLLRDHYMLRLFPMPNLACQWLLAFVSALAGPFLAAKIVVVGYCSVSIAVCWKASKTFFGTHAAAGFVVLVSLVTFNACFWHGYMNYQFGLVALLWYFQASQSKRFSPLALFGISVLLYACHAATWLAFVLLVLHTARSRPNRLRICLALLPTVALFSIYVLNSHGTASSTHHSMGVASFLAYKCYTVAKTGPFHNLIGPNGIGANSTRWMYRSGITVNLMFASGLFLCIVHGIRKAWQSERLRAMAPLWFVLFVLFAVMPSDLREVVNLGERFLYILLISLLLAIGPSVWVNWLSVITLAGLVLTTVQIPRVSMANMQQGEAVMHEPEGNGQSYRADGLFSHRLYQNDERRVELRDHATVYAPLLFDTSVLQERDPGHTRKHADGSKE